MCVGRNRSVLCAGGGPILCSPMTLRGGWGENILGDRCLARRWPTRSANCPGLSLEPIGEEVPGISLSGGHLRPEETGEFSGHRGGHDGAAVFAGGQAAEAAAQTHLGCPRASHHLGRQPLVSAVELGSDPGGVLVGPGCFDEGVADVGVAGLGDRPRIGVAPEEYSEGTRPTKPMNGRRRGTGASRRPRRPKSARPVRPRPDRRPGGGLGLRTTRPAGMATGRPRWPRRAARALDHGQQVGEGRGRPASSKCNERNHWRCLSVQDLPSRYTSPRRSRTPGVAGGPGGDPTWPYPASGTSPGIPPRPGGHPHRHQLPSPVKTHQPTRVTAIGLDPVPRGHRYQRRRHHLTGHSHRGQQPVQLIAGRASLVTDPQPSRPAQTSNQTTDRHLIMSDLVNDRGGLRTTQHPNGDGVFRDIQPHPRHAPSGRPYCCSGHGRLLSSLWLRPPAMVDDPRINYRTGAGRSITTVRVPNRRSGALSALFWRGECGGYASASRRSAPEEPGRGSSDPCQSAAAVPAVPAAERRSEACGQVPTLSG